MTIDTSQLLVSPSVVMSVFTEGNTKNINGILQNENFLKGKLHLFYLFETKP